MANLKTISIVVALVTTCLAVKPPGFVEKPAVHDESPPNYSFEYEVRDHDGGAQGHTEVRRGLYAVGGFYTRLPGENGAQRVSYYADDWGFHPVLVAYGGHGFNTRLAFGDKAVATANAAAGSGGGHSGGPSINAIGVNIPPGLNPLPDLTQTGAAALAAEAPHIPDAANLVASIGQPPAPPQPPKPSLAVGPLGTTFLQPSLQIAKPIQPAVQQIGQIQPLRPLLQPQLPQRLRLPLPVATSAPVRPITPFVPVAPIVPISNYPSVQPFAPVRLGLVDLSGPTSTSIISSSLPARRPSYIPQTAAPVVVSTTPAPVTVVDHSVLPPTGGGAILQGISSPATSFVSSVPQTVQTVTKAPAVVTQFQTVTPATTVISGGVDAFKESSAAAAAAAASALSAAAASSSGGQLTHQESSFGGQGGEVYYSQQTGNRAVLANSVTSGSFVGATGQAQQVGIIGQTEYSQQGGYHYERPASGGLTYTPLPTGGTFGKGQVGGAVGQGFQYSPFLTTGYHQSGYVYSPGYQGFYQNRPQFAFGGGASSTSSSSFQSSSSQGSSGFKGDGGGLAYYPNKIESSRPQGATSFQSQVGQTQFQQAYPSLPPTTVGGYEEVGLGLSTVGFEEQQTTVSTPAPQVTEEEEYNVTPTPFRPIVVPEFPKETSPPDTFVETSTPAPPAPSPTLTPAITSSTISSSVPSTIEVTTPTPLTSSTPITPFYSTFPANAPCIACQSTRSQEITLLTAPATDSATTLDSELQQIFFPDPTPSLQGGISEETIVSTPRPVDVTPKPLEQSITTITTTKEPTVSVEVLEGEANRATTLSGFEGSTEAREEILTTERGGGAQFVTEEVGGNGQFFSGLSGSNGPLFPGGGNIYSGASGSGAQFLTKSNVDSTQILSAERLGGGQIYSGSSGSGGNTFAGASGGGSEYYSGGASGGQIYSGGSVSGGKGFAGASGGGSEYYSGGGGASGGQIYTVTSTPAPPVSVSLGVTTPSVLYVDRPVAVPVPYAVPQLVPYAVRGSSASSYRGRAGQRLSSSSSSSDSYESSTPSVISVTQITKIRTSGRKNADRGYVKQVVEESGSSSAEEEEEEEVIVRDGSIKLGSSRFGSGGGYLNRRLPPAPFRSSTLADTKSFAGNYGERIRVGRPRKLCIEYGGFKPPLVPSDPDYSQSFNLR